MDDGIPHARDIVFFAGMSRCNSCRLVSAAVTGSISSGAGSVVGFGDDFGLRAIRGLECFARGTAFMRVALVPVIFCGMARFAFILTLAPGSGPPEEHRPRSSAP